MKHYDFLLKNMGLDVLCAPPPSHPSPNVSIVDFWRHVLAKIHPRAADFSVKCKVSFAWFQCTSHYPCHKTLLLMFVFGDERWLQVPRLSCPTAPCRVSGHPSLCLTKWRPNILILIDYWSVQFSEIKVYKAGQQLRKDCPEPLVSTETFQDSLKGLVWESTQSCPHSGYFVLTVDILSSWWIFWVSRGATVCLSSEAVRWHRSVAPR